MYPKWYTYNYTVSVSVPTSMYWRQNEKVNFRNIHINCLGKNQKKIYCVKLPTISEIQIYVCTTTTKTSFNFQKSSFFYKIDFQFHMYIFLYIYTQPLVYNLNTRTHSEWYEPKLYTKQIFWLLLFRMTFLTFSPFLPLYFTWMGLSIINSRKNMYFL